MAEMVIGETVSLEEMGGARSIPANQGAEMSSETEEEALDWCRQYLRYLRAIVQRPLR